MNQTPWPLVGTVGFDGPHARTFQHLGGVEFPDSFLGVPKATTLKRMQQAAGPGFEFVVRASVALSHGAAEPVCRKVKLPYLKGLAHPARTLDLGEAAELAWGFTVSVARALGAGHVLLSTPTGFRCTSENEQRLRAFTERHVEGSGLHLIWDAQGEWPIAVRLRLATELGLMPTYDPLIDPEVPPPDEAYLRVLGRSRATRPLGDDDLALIAEAATNVKRARVMFHTPIAYKDARALLALVGGSGA